MAFILACDAGTTSSRTLIFNDKFEIKSLAQKEFTQFTPFPSAVEHDPEEIWETQLSTIRTAVNKLKKQLIETKSHLKSKSSSNLKFDLKKEIKGIAITNQRETIVAWDRFTGKSLHPALVWQDQRTAEYCDWVKSQGHELGIRSRTGLLMDPYFSASKMHWLLTHVPDVIQAKKEGRLCFGTIDSWLIFNLTQGSSHVTDVSNASRTMLMNIHTGDWDPELCDFFGVPIETLPEILENDSTFGEATITPIKGIPITGVAGDQQASLFGHGAFTKGERKNTYGTGCFLLKNIGQYSSGIGGDNIPKGILETVAWKLNGKTTFAHEGAVMIGGAAIQFLRDNLGIIKSAQESEELASSLNSNEDVYFVPAFAGLGTPHWDSSARGVFIGMTRRTGRAHFARAALEAIAFQSADLMSAIPSRKALKVDGGATRNEFLMQFQADILGREIHVAAQVETTALGAAMIASIGAGIYKMKDLKQFVQAGKTYSPLMSPKNRKLLLSRWHEALERSKGWAV